MVYMLPKWFCQGDLCPPFEEIDAMPMHMGEALTVKLHQIAHDAGESAEYKDWHIIRTEVKIVRVAWSDTLGTGVYVIVARGGYYLAFSWDRVEVVALLAGRNMKEKDEKHAIETALARCGEKKGVTSNFANWITNFGVAQ